MVSLTKNKVANVTLQDRVNDFWEGKGRSFDQNVKIIHLDFSMCWFEKCVCVYIYEYVCI